MVDEEVSKNSDEKGVQGILEKSDSSKSQGGSAQFGP
jgi:hypothetical protein